MVDWVKDYEEDRVMETTMASSAAGGMGLLNEIRVVESIVEYSPSGDNDEENVSSLRRRDATNTTTARNSMKGGYKHRNRISTTTLRTASTTTTFAASSVSPDLVKLGWKRKFRKGILTNATGKGNTTTTTTTTASATIGTEKYVNVMSSTSGGDNGVSNWKGSLRWTYIPRSTATPATLTTTAAGGGAAAAATSSSITGTIIKGISRRMRENNGEQKQPQQDALPVIRRPLLARSIRTTVTTSGGGGGGRDNGGILRGKRARSNSSRLSSSALTAAEKEEFSAASSGVGRKLMMSGAIADAAAPGGTYNGGSDEGISSSSGGMHPPSSSSLDPNNNNNYITGSGDDDVVDIGVSRRLLDIHQISSRLHRSFPWEGLGLHRNATIRAGSIGHAITDRIGFNPATTPHTLMFSSLYIVPLILLLGLVVALIWLVCACTYHTMKRIKFALCPGKARDSSSSRKKGKSSNNEASSNNPCGIEDGNKKPQILTPEILEMRRQERLAFLQAECANLEQQLTGLRLASPQIPFEEKSATLTSRASDSDLEYLGASESPPLKRNSISLQDIPQSVIRIRREKELRQIKEEIECLRTIAQQEKEKADQVAKVLKGVLLRTRDFELPESKPGSPSDTKVEPLSQHISHLKTQRKLNEIRSELEDLAIQLLHADEIKAKRASLQDLPRTTLNIQRENNIITMTGEISKMKNYKLQKKNLIETALEKSSVNPKGASGGTSESGEQTGSKSFSNSTKASPSTTQDVAAKYADPEFAHRASMRRQREQELNRVRVELKDLAYKLNLNPMNYISDDRVRLVPSQSMQSTSSITGQSSSYNKSTSSSSALNHV